MMAGFMAKWELPPRGRNILRRGFNDDWEKLTDAQWEDYEWQLVADPLVRERGYVVGKVIVYI